MAVVVVCPFFSYIVFFMKHMVLFLFLFVIIVAAQYYTSLRIWQITPNPPFLKVISIVLYNLGFVSLLSYFALHLNGGKILSFEFSSAIYNSGNAFLILLLYAFLLFALLDVAKMFHLIPPSYLHSSWLGFSFVLITLSVLMIGGNRHYQNKYCEELAFATEKKLPQPLKIIFLSDVHLGYHNTRETLSEWVGLINEKNPDLVLIAGDLIDFSVIPLTEQNMAEEFYKIKAPIYACMGNHEYISGEEKAKEFFKKAGIRLLQDEALLLQKYGLLIVGRDDRFNKSRKTLPQLIEGYETDSLYTIVLDHQPYHLEEAEKSGIDLQLSGHTHDGQVWPLNYITDLMYENSHGFSRRGETNYYVSSGMGIWGGKFRIGTRSEYVVITIE